MPLLEVLGLKKKPKSVPPASGPAVSSGGKPSDAQMQMLNEATLYAPLLAKAQSDLAAWTDPGGADARAKIQKGVIDAARAKAKDGDYPGAMGVLAQMPTALSAAKDAVEKAKDEKALKEALAAIAPVVAQCDIGLPGVTEPRLHAKLDADLKKLKADIGAARLLVDTKAAVQAVKALKPTAEQLKGRIDAAKANSAWIMGDYTTLRGNTQLWINAVASKPAKQAMQAVFDGIDAEKNGFLDAGDAASVKTVSHPKLRRIYELGVKVVDEGGTLDRVFRVHNLIDKVGTLATPAVKQEIKALTLLEKAGVPAGGTIDALEQSMKTFNDRLAKLRTDVEGLRSTDAGANSDKKKAEIEKTLGLCKDAATSVDKSQQAVLVPKVTALYQELKTAVALTDAAARGKALVALDTKAHALLKETKTASLKAQIAKSGNKAVDDLITAMPDNTDSDDDLAVCEAAMQARFGIKVEVAPDLKKKSLPRMYKVIASVPAWQTKQAKFKKLEVDNTRAGGVAFYQDGAEPKIALHDLPEGPGGSTQVPDVDPDTKTVQSSYFDFTTLHEVGHAVDAKINFMGQRMGNAEFGGWEEPNTTDAVAEYFGDKGGFYKRHSGGGKKATKADLKALLVSYLDTKDCAKPADATKPLGSLLDKWDEITADAVVKVAEDGLTLADEVWDDGAAKAARVQVAGRCFHNSYGGNTWVSYAYASRAPTGISTYQWRAPGEWFAEIYALYYSGKLRESHPLHKWFKESAVSEDAAKKPAAKAAEKKAKAKAKA